MDQINSKILLFGEYAVLHQGMALVMPCDKYSGSLDFYESATDKNFALESNQFLKKFSEFVANHTSEKFILEVKRFEQEIEEGLFFKSTIPQGYGVGSSGAIVAAIVLRYLKKAKYFKDELKEVTYHKIQELKKVLGELESHFHGVSSGLDPLSILLNQPILYKGQNDIITTVLPENKVGNKNVIFLLNTQQPHDTSIMMSQFESMIAKESFRKKFQNYVLTHNNHAINNFLNLKLEDFYQNVSEISSFQLEEMEDFFPQHLLKEVKKGLNNGDFFLKLCGAGGGGFVLGFTQDWETTQEQLGGHSIEEIYCF